MNYSDMLKDYNQYFSYLNDKYLEGQAPIIKVFKLDKKATILDETYGAVKHSKIFLPPFEIRAKYLTNSWVGALNMEPYQEIEQNIKFELNFNRMVQIIRSLKNTKIISINITFAGVGVPSIKKTEESIDLFINNIMVSTYRMTDGNLAKANDLVAFINAIPYFNAESIGENDFITKIINFEKTEFTGKIFNFYSLNDMYKNITDIIEIGDAILTNKYRIYQVLNANPTGDFGWNYAIYTLECNLYPIEELDGLPSDYRYVIEQNQYGMRKIKKE